MSVYFIQQGDDGPVKIGVSWSPHARLANLQVANPCKLHMLGARQIVDGDPYTIERQIHEHLSDWHIRNEWFEASEPVLEFVREASDPERPQVPGPVAPEELSEEDRYQQMAARLRAAVDGTVA